MRRSYSSLVSLMFWNWRCIFFMFSSICLMFSFFGTSKATRAAPLSRLGLRWNWMWLISSSGARQLRMEDKTDYQPTKVLRICGLKGIWMR